MEEILGIIIAALLSENFILVKFYGICPFMGVSKKIDTALGMGMAVTFVMGIASAACYAVNLLLEALSLQYMQTVAFILVIAALVQVVEMFLKKNVLFASIRERVDKATCPESFKGYPITLIAAGLLALAFMGFSGLSIF